MCWSTSLSGPSSNYFLTSRQNLNLHTCLRNRTLVVIDALSRTSHPPEGLAADPSAPGHPATPGVVVCPPLADSLLPLYDVIRSAFSELAPGPALLVLGDLSTLEWIGISSTELTRFIRAVRALAVQVSPAEPAFLTSTF